MTIQNANDKFLQNETLCFLIFTDFTSHFTSWMGVVALILLVYFFQVFKKVSLIKLAKHPQDESFSAKTYEARFQKWLDKS